MALSAPRGHASRPAQFIEKRMALNAEGQPFDAKIYLNEMGEEKPVVLPPPCL